MVAAFAAGAVAVWFAMRSRPGVELSAGAQPSVAEVASAPATTGDHFAETQLGNAESEPVRESPSEVRLPERVIGEAEVLVADGETVVTEGYESSPGEFVFSSLTPTVKTLADGTTGVGLEIKGFKVTVSGDVDADFEQKSSRIMEMKSGGAVTVTTMTDDGIYNLSATVNLDDLPLIRLQAKGAKMGPSPGPRFLNGPP